MSGARVSGADAGAADAGGADAGGARLRLARQARGFSQQQLAGMAGVSRQAVSALESGQSDPSLRVALALAGALGMTVEELFGAEDVVPAVTARLVAGPGQRRPGDRDHGGGPGGRGGQEPSSGPRVTLAPVGDAFAAYPLSGPNASRAGFLPAGGIVVGEPGGAPAAPAPAGRGGDRRVEVRPIGPPRPTLVAAGCDPALPLLAPPLGLLDPPVAFAWWPCSSQEALRLAGAGLVHVAGVHLSDRPGGHDVPATAGLIPGGAEVIGFSAWREGLVLRPESARRVGGLADIARAGLRLVNREPGAEARRLLDRELAELGIDPGRIPGYRTMVTGHLQVADAVAAGLADAGVASEPAALAYGLAFAPLATERFDLVIPVALAERREVQALLRVLSSRWLRDQLASLPGYDPSPCGGHVASLGKPG